MTAKSQIMGNNLKIKLVCMRYQSCIDIVPGAES